MKECLNAVLMCASLPLLIAGLVLFLVCFSGPFAYFASSRVLFGTGALFDKYHDEGLRRSADVVERWMTTGTDKSPPQHCIRVLYRAAPEEEGEGAAYTKEFTVPNAAAQAPVCHEVVVLPGYPRSAISAVWLQRERSGEEGLVLARFGMLWSVVWAGAVYTVLLRSVWRTDWPVLGTALAAGEFVLAWGVGYLAARARRNGVIRGRLFGAAPAAEGGAASEDEEPQPQRGERIPSVDYVKFFPASAHSWRDVIETMISDYAGFIVFLMKSIIKIILGILMFIFLLAFGGGYCLMMRFLYYPRISRLFVEGYATRGKGIVGTLINESALWVTVQYGGADNSNAPSQQRYEKTLKIPRAPVPGRCCGGFESKPVTSAPRLVVLPGVPTSARLRHEVDVHVCVSQRRRLIMTLVGLVLFPLQTAYATFVGGGLALPDVPWRNVALAYVALQLGLGCVGAFVYSRYMRHVILYDAKEVAP